MNVIVKSVNSPFSFFCVAEDENKDEKITQEDYVKNTKLDKIELSDVNHGQYVAVLLKNKWVRGIVSMENRFLIWLVDHGTYIRPTENTVYVKLPAEYKKLPSKVFEASIHGVTPIGLILDDLIQFRSEIQLTWSKGALEQTQQIINEAKSIYFVPIAILSTKKNDVVLGDLYLQLKSKKFVNLIDEMSTKMETPMHKFLERNKEDYLKNLSTFYCNRRIHHACLLKPNVPLNLPTITTETTIVEYNAICDQAEPFTQDSGSNSEASFSSVTYIDNVDDAPNRTLKLTPSEIEKYSNEYIVVSGREYNVLTVLINKARDLYICEKYKDAKSIGRANTRLKKVNDTHVS